MLNLVKELAGGGLKLSLALWALDLSRGPLLWVCKKWLKTVLKKGLMSFTLGGQVFVSSLH